MVRIGIWNAKVMWYLECSKCKRRIDCKNTFELVNLANKEGWRYLFSENKILCPDCIKREINGT